MLFDWCLKSQHARPMVIIWMSKHGVFSGFMWHVFEAYPGVVLNGRALGLARICDFSLVCPVGSVQEISANESDFTAELSDMSVRGRQESERFLM